ncbi:MAG: phospholipid carrier-dependent glycosyltransferase [Betaproteobacteria bacterium]|nr:phospholipid carrier-dependent glycosyltransferase [Betaproteobacteria bacterium]
MEKRISLRIAALAVGFLFFGILGMANTALFDVDEGAFSEATREMLASGDFGFTFLNGKPRFDKPILVYWLQALSISILGQTELGARMVSLLAGIASAWIAARFAFRWSKQAESALMVFALYGSCLGPLVMRHAATADALLYLWLTASSCCLIESIRLRESGEETPEGLAKARQYLRLAWMSSAFALLTKGLIGLLVPAFIVLGFCMVRRNFKALGWSFSDATACLAWLAIGLPWYAYAYWRFSDDFIQGLFGKHHVGRSMQAMEGHTGSWFYTLIMVLLLSLPFTPVLISSLWQQWRKHALRASDDQKGPGSSAAHEGISAASLGLLSHGLGMLAVFSVVATKLPHYAMYALLPMLLLAALSPQIAKLTWLSTCTFGLLMIATIAGATEQGMIALAFGALGFAMFTKHLLNRWLYIGLALQITVCLLLLPALGQVLQAPIKALATRAGDAVTVSFQLRAPSFSFYRSAVTEDRLPLPGEQVVLRASDFPNLHRASGDRTGWVLVDGAGPLLLLRRESNDGN